MSTPIATKRRRWWDVIGYEVSMFRGLRGLGGIRWVSTPSEVQQTVWLLSNSITEGRVLHTRNLCDFCTSKNPNDIQPRDLFDNYDTDPKYERLRGLIKRLDGQYGKSNNAGDARWAFNKKLAHPTKERDEGFDYGPSLDRVVPVLEKIIGEIETLRRHPFAVEYRLRAREQNG